MKNRDNYYFYGLLSVIGLLGILFYTGILTLSASPYTHPIFKIDDASLVNPDVEAQFKAGDVYLARLKRHKEDGWQTKAVSLDVVNVQTTDKPQFTDQQGQHAPKISQKVRLLFTITFQSATCHQSKIVYWQDSVLNITETLPSLSKSAIEDAGYSVN